MPPPSISRRSFLGTLALGVAVTTLTGTAPAAAPSAAPATDADRLDVKDPTAVALGYVEDAARVDAKKFPGYVKGSTCENCLQLQGKAGEPYRPCTLFPGKRVAAAGWCSSWTAEM